MLLHSIKTTLVVLSLVISNFAMANDQPLKEPNSPQVFYDTTSFDAAIGNLLTIYVSQEPELSKKTLDSLEQTWVARIDLARRAQIYTIRSYIDNRYQKYKSGTRHALTAIKLSKQSGDLTVVPSLLFQLGIMHRLIGDYDKALYYMDEGIEFFEKDEFAQGQSRGHNLKARVYSARQEWDKAQEELNIALRLLDYETTPLKELPSVIQHEIAITLSSLGGLMVRRKNYEQAVFYFKQTHSISERLDFKNITGFVRVKLSFARALALNGQLVEAKKYQREAIEFAAGRIRTSEKITNARINILIAEAEGNFENAIQATTKLELLQAEYNEQKDEKDLLGQLAELEEFAKIQEIELAGRREKHKIAISQKKESNMFNLFVIILVLTIIGAAMLIYRRNRFKKGALILEIGTLKNELLTQVVKKTIGQNNQILDRALIQSKINSKLNESDWKIITTVYERPMASIKEIAEQVSLSTHGISSSLRKMYSLFDIQSQQNKKMDLIVKITEMCSQSFDQSRNTSEN